MDRPPSGRLGFQCRIVALSGQQDDAHCAGDTIRISISYTWTDALSWDGWSWNGTIAGTRQLRCDGVVEISYELSGKDVWGKNGTHYPIQDYTGEHNNLGKDNPQIELSPIVQRGGVSGSPTKLKSEERYEPNL